MSDHSGHWGRCCHIIAVSHVRSGERTNLGVIVFDRDGNRVGFRVDTARRALARGDLTPGDSLGGYDADTYWTDYIKRFAEGHDSIKEVERSHQSMGHAMSQVQAGQLLPVRVDLVSIDSIFDRDVLGKK